MKGKKGGGSYKLATSIACVRCSQYRTAKATATVTVVMVRKRFKLLQNIGYAS
jgi:hypothetical protein